MVLNNKSNLNFKDSESLSLYKKYLNHQTLIRKYLQTKYQPKKAKLQYLIEGRVIKLIINYNEEIDMLNIEVLDITDKLRGFRKDEK